MKKRHPEHVNHERWLVSYADFITLLFAFFVVMYALSMENLAKVKAAAESIRKAFGGPAVIQGSSGLPSDAAARLSPFGHGDAAPGGGVSAASAGGEGTAAAYARAAGAEMQQVQKELADELKDAAALETGADGLSERMQTLFDHRGLVVRLSAHDFFGRGEAAVRPDLQPLLDRVGRIVARAAKSGRELRIEGYAGGDEAVAKGYASDWELSAARAAWVARYWIARFGLDPARVGVAGYAHYRPLPAEDAGSSKTARKSEWAAGKERRVEIVILNPALQPSAQATAPADHH